MGYKALGYVVWQAVKWVARRKLAASAPKLALGAAGVAVLAGLIAAGRQAASDN